MKRNVQEYADSIHAAIEAKKLEIFDDVERRTQLSLEHIGIQKDKFVEQVKQHESEIERTEKIITRSTSAEIMQPNDVLNIILTKENSKEETITDRENERFSARLSFVKNQKLFDLACGEQIGSLKSTQTRAQQSNGKGINEAIVV